MKPVRTALIAALTSIGLTTSLLAPHSRAQTPPPKPAAAAPKKAANLNQIMQGIMFPNSNVVFAAQDLSVYKPADDPASSPNPLTSTYGGWQAVENASLALAETADMLTGPGRMCSNGKAVPVQKADWKKFVEELRAAGWTAYKAAKSKNQDAIIDAGGTVSDACTDCHAVYRDKTGNDKDRCL